MRPSSVTARILLAYRSRYAQLACLPKDAANSAGEYAARIAGSVTVRINLLFRERMRQRAKPCLTVKYVPISSERDL